MKAANEKYDMIIVDAPDPATAVLNRYYTREFFGEAETLLNPDGVFVIGVTSTSDLRGTAIANRNATVYHTLRSVFWRVLPAGERFMFYFATNAPEQVSVDVPNLQERYRERNIETEGFSYQHYHTLLQPGQLQRVNWIVRNHGRNPEAHLEGPGLVPLSPGTVAEQESAEKQLPPLEQRYFTNSDFKPIGYYYTVMFWELLHRDVLG
jgi:spermidine synthase